MKNDDTGRLSDKLVSKNQVLKRIDDIIERNDRISSRLDTMKLNIIYDRTTVNLILATVQEKIEQFEATVEHIKDTAKEDNDTYLELTYIEGQLEICYVVSRMILGRYLT